MSGVPSFRSTLDRLTYVNVELRPVPMEFRGRISRAFMKLGLTCRADDRNFYGIFSSIISSKMTKTCPNTKESLQNPRKASRQSQECKKTRKSQKMKKSVVHRATMASIVPRWRLLARQDNNRRKSEEYLFIVLRCTSSCYDAPHRGTMTLLGDQADEMHRISYNFELYLPIVSRWLAEAHYGNYK
ncbi:hypothetical protein QL285_094111 [Trifolium repens]|nr:hypothetical protein QL285_094111 [Trifolium repens]